MTAKELLYDWGGANVWLFQAFNLHSPGRLDELMEWVSCIGSYWNLPLVAGGWLAVAILLRQAIHIVEAGEREYSLPRGHASYSALLAATLWPLIGLPGRLAVLLFVLAIGFSRIWLGAHFPADVAVGYLVGLCSA